MTKVYKFAPRKFRMTLLELIAVVEAMTKDMYFTETPDYTEQHFVEVEINDDPKPPFTCMDVLK
jgi:hypothetical protein